MDNEEKITREQAAAELGLKHARIYSLIKLGFIRGEKIDKTWWVRREDVEAWKINRPKRGRPFKNQEDE